MIDTRYREFLASLAIQQCLVHGESPSSSQIRDETNLLLADFPDQTKPQVSALLAKLILAARERPSAAKFNKFFQATQEDLTVLHQECVGQSEAQSGLLSRNLKEIKMLQSRLRSLEHNLSSAMLVNKDSLGYQYYLADNLSDSSNIDLTRTTAALDFNAHVASIGQGGNGLYRYPLDHLTGADCQALVLTKTNLVSTGINVTDLSNIFRSDDQVWKVNLKYSQPGQRVVFDFNLRLNDNPIIINRIRLVNFAFSSNPTNLQVMYSLDNYTWLDLPVVPTQRIFDEAAELIFPPVQVKWLKLRLSKDWQDYQSGDYYVYEFGLKNLSLFEQDYDDNGAELVSKILTAQDNNGQQIYFDQVALEVCEVVPDNTGIDYFISFDGGMQFSQIASRGRKQANVSQVLQLQKNVLTPSVAFGLDLTTSFFYQNPEDILLGLTLPAELDLTSLQLWRNLGVRGQIDPVRYGTTGWVLDGDYYSTTALVTGTSNLIFNLGSTSLILDGITRTGTVELTPGVHQIQVTKNSWSPLYLSGSSTPVRSLSQVVELGSGAFQGIDHLGRRAQAFDPLYPHNHKFIVEGLDYSPQQGNNWLLTYPGVTLYAQTCMKQVSVFDLTHNIGASDLGYFAITPDFSQDGSPINRLLTKYLTVNPLSQDNYGLEQFQLFFLETTQQIARTVVFKAVMAQTDPKVSPQLYSYAIKLGQNPGSYNNISA